MLFLIKTHTANRPSDHHTCPVISCDTYLGTQMQSAVNGVDLLHLSLGKAHHGGRHKLLQIWPKLSCSVPSIDCLMPANGKLEAAHQSVSCRCQSAVKFSLLQTRQQEALAITQSSRCGGKHGVQKTNHGQGGESGGH